MFHRGSGDVLQAVVVQSSTHTPQKYCSNDSGERTVRRSGNVAVDCGGNLNGTAGAFFTPQGILEACSTRTPYGTRRYVRTPYLNDFPWVFQNFAPEHYGVPTSRADLSGYL